MSSREPIRVFEKYEVIRRLATGGMGDIFLARQIGVAGFNRVVVLKSLRPDVVERDEFFAQFLNEARTAATLNHPNVVAVYEIDEFRGVYFIAMEYIDGTDLGAVLRAAQASRQRLPFRFSAGVIHDAALGLHHAHTAKDGSGQPSSIVHRDVSPQNIMVRLDGIAKVVDFGIAAAGNQIDPFRGRLQGKLRYMSPEQIRGRALTGASDQFSLGVVLWELITQRRLFSAKEPTAVLREISLGSVTRPSQLVPDVPAALEAAVMRMLSREPSERFPSAKDAALALRSFLESTGGAADQQISRFVTVMVGAQVKERTKDLTPEAVTISGLLDTAELRCQRCKTTNPLRNRYCMQCGAPLSSEGGGPRRSEPPPAQPPPGAVARPIAPRSLSSLREMLSSSAVGLDRLITGQRREVVVVATRIRRGSAPALEGKRHEVEQRMLRTQTAVIEAFDPEIVRLTSGEALLVFGASERRAADGMRALKAAIELAAAVERVARELALPVQLTAVIDTGEVDLIHPSDATYVVKGPGLERVERSLQAVPESSSGIFIGTALRPRMVGEAELGPERGGLSLFSELRGAGSAERLRLIGRRDEVVASREVLAAAARGQGGALCFVSDPGGGKTRLLEEAAQLASKQGFATAMVRAAHGEAATGSGLIFAVLRQALTQFVFTGLNREPRLEDRLGVLGLSSATRRLVEDHLSGAQRADDPGQADQAALSALLSLARFQPVAVLVDDLHAAGPRAKAAFLELLAHIKSGRVAVFTTRDPAEDAALAGLRSVVLDPLSDEKVLALAQAQAGGVPLPPPVAQLILVRAAGNPGTATLLVTTLIALGGMVREGDRWLATQSLLELDLPTHLDGLLSARLDRLSRPAQAFLRVASVLGSPFSTRLVLGVLRFSGDERALIGEVEATQLVRPLFGTLDGQEFVQRSVELRVKAGLLEPDRRGIHRRSAEILLRDPSPTSVTLETAARHLVEAGDDSRAAPVARRAAEAQPTADGASALYSLSLEAYRRLLSKSTDRAELASEVLDLIADATPSLAARDLDRARRLLDEFAPLISEVGASPSRARALRARSAVSLALGKLSEAEADLAAALALLADEADLRVKAEVLEAQAKLLEERGRFSEAAQRLSEAISLAQSLEESRDLWRPLNGLGRLYLRLGQKEQAHQLFEAAEAAADSEGSELGRSAAMTNRAAALAQDERYDEALVLLEGAALAASTAGDALGRARIAYNRGRIHLARKESVEAKAALLEAASVATEIGWAEGVALAHQAMAAANLTPSL